MIMILHYAKNYMYENNDNNITFYTKKDRYEIGWYNKIKNELYVNSDYYKKQFKSAYAEILKTYKNNDTKIIEYCNVSF